MCLWGASGRVMQTGGFKGRSREVDGPTLRDELAKVFEVPTDHVVAEYGMTELGSQAYEGCLRSSLLPDEPATAHDVFVSPPWMRVLPVDPVSLEPVPEGEDRDRPHRGPDERRFCGGRADSRPCPAL